MDWTPRRFGSAWKVKKVYGNRRHNHDFPSALGVLILSPRAVDALRDLLEPVAELLPVLAKQGTFYAIDVFKKVDVIDYESSSKSWDWEEMDEFETTLEEFVIDETKLEANPLFRVPQDISGIKETTIQLR